MIRNQTRIDQESITNETRIIASHSCASRARAIAIADRIGSGSNRSSSKRPKNKQTSTTTARAASIVCLSRETPR